jgi:hypothetical protein
LLQQVKFNQNVVLKSLYEAKVGKYHLKWFVLLPISVEFLCITTIENKEKRIGKAWKRKSYF